MASGPQDDLPETVTLADGTALTLRAIRPDDAPRLQALAERLSPQSMYFRAMMPLKSLSDRDARRLATVDYARRMALVATRPTAEGEEIVGVARYAADRTSPSGEAEVAVVVEDRLQGHGLGTLLIMRLGTYARRHGIRAFRAVVLAANTAVERMIQATGLPAETVVAASGERQIRIILDSER
ncbi:MAG TPA: GNAT family N-acetyltransferase [Anaerolineae bacterium]